jgi:GNAT superfamily N-acetyltransferase
MKAELSSDDSAITPADELARLEACAYGLRYSDWERWFWEFAKSYGRVFVIRRGGRLVGAAMLLPTMTETVYLETVVVHPRYQGKGTGSALLTDVCTYADIHQVTLELHTLDPNDSRAEERQRKIISLYERFGFRKQGNPTPRYYKDALYQHMVREPSKERPCTGC